MIYSVVFFFVPYQHSFELYIIPSTTSKDKQNKFKQAPRTAGSNQIKLTQTRSQCHSDSHSICSQHCSTFSNCFLPPYTGAKIMTMNSLNRRNSVEIVMSQHFLWSLFDLLAPEIINNNNFTIYVFKKS